MGKKNAIDEVFSGIEELQRNLEKINGTHEYQIGEVLSDDFMKEHTKFSNVDNFFNACGIFSEDDFLTFPESKLDLFVQENSDFSNWQEMISQAGSDYIKNQLGFD